MEHGFNTAVVNAFLTGAEILPGDLLQSLPVALCICDNTGKIMYYNEYAALLWNGRDMIGEHLPKNITLSTVIPLTNAAGTLIARLYHIKSVITDSSSSDATAKKRYDLDDALKQSEERYHKMIEEVEDYAILLMDKSGIIMNWNKGAEKIKGYHESEIIGRHFSVFYLPEDRERVLPDRLMAEAKRTGKALQEGWRMRKDGSRFWGSIVITALHDVDNNVIGFSKVTRDLTERKMAEDRIRQYASELEFQNKELEQFAYAAAHDMKEPLRKILFYNNYIVDNASDVLPDKAKDYLVRSLSAATRMQGLIDDLLTYSKASSFSQEQEETDVRAIIDDVLLAHHASIEEANAIIDIGPLPVVHVIPFQFTQLFDNLISNSLKYRCPERRLTINITYEMSGPPADEKAGAHTGACYYKFILRDNGVGFDPEYASKIFELFQRLHTQPGITGTGIGLAICKKIVLNHRGFIRANGIPGEGATFEIYIPCEINQHFSRASI